MQRSLPEFNLMNKIISSTCCTYEDEQHVLELLSTSMNNIIDLPNKKPVHLHFLRRGFDPGCDTDKFEQELKKLPVTIIFCDSWEKFTMNFKHFPNSVSFDVAGSNHDTTTDIVSMINTLSKLVSGNANISITARIDKNTSYDTIKFLQKSNIVGIIPSLYDFGEQEVIKALHAQWANIPYWPKHIIEQLSGSTKSTTNLGDITLTPRQEQIFSIIITKGISNKSIAKMLNITESTVKLHMGHILKKFGVKNRTQLVAFNKN